MLIRGVMQQERPYWCWAACAAMILDSLGQPLTQCAIARRHLGLADDCCHLPKLARITPGQAPRLHACDRWQAPDDIDRLWSDHQIPATVHVGPLPRPVLEAYLRDARQPVQAWLGAFDVRASHVLLVVGQQEDGRFVLADPLFSDWCRVTYDELAAARGGWTRSWILG